jgi:hypothetical protein
MLTRWLCPKQQHEGPGVAIVLLTVLFTLYPLVTFQMAATLLGLPRNSRHETEFLPNLHNTNIVRLPVE